MRVAWSGDGEVPARSPCSKATEAFDTRVYADSVKESL